MAKANWKAIFVSFVAAAAVYALPAFFDLGLTQASHGMAVVAVFVALLWILEAIPLHVTGLAGAFLMIVALGFKPKEVFQPFFDPTIVLLLGGFVIAVAMSKHKVDEWIAHEFIARAGSDARFVVLALLATATFISMWISNSATAAILMPIALVVLRKNSEVPGKSNFGKAAVLAVGYGATIGGIGTIIGSTPNVIAAKFLRDSGLRYEFFDWFYRGFPFMLLLMIAAWIVLITLFKPGNKPVQTVESEGKLNANQWKVLGVFAFTIVLWVTEPWHRIASEVVAVVPILLFYALGLLEGEDVDRVDWPSLLLVGGGLALGYGIHQAGLDVILAKAISDAVLGQSVLALFLMLAAFGAILTLGISNTTAAAVYLPIVVALAAGFGVDPASTVTLAAIGVSLDFTFAFGTPPTAIAYGTGYVRSKEIALAGAAISAIGVVLLALLGLAW